MESPEEFVKLWGKASEEEEEKVDALARRLGANEAFERYRKQGFDDITGEFRLLRFIRGYGAATAEKNIDRAYEAYVEFLEVREKFGLDDDRKEALKSPMCRTRELPHGEEMLEIVPNWFSLGRARDEVGGHIINYSPLGDWETKKLREDDGFTKYNKYYHTHAEARQLQLARLSKEEGRMVAVIIVWDMVGYGLSKVGDKEWEANNKANNREVTMTMCECMAIMYIINCPSWVRTIWRGISVLLPERTRRKIFLLGSDFQEEFLKFMTASQLREMLSLRKAKAEGEVAGGVGSDAPHEGKINIAAGAEVSLPVFLSAGQRIEWRYHVDYKDVDFSVTAFPGSGPLEVAPLVRTSAGDGFVEGSCSFEEIVGANVKGAVGGGDGGKGAVAAAAAAAVAAPAPAPEMVLCRVTFSNAYSWFTSKDVTFKVTKVVT